jgi:hypothetical protein
MRFIEAYWAPRPDASWVGTKQSDGHSSLRGRSKRFANAAAFCDSFQRYRAGMKPLIYGSGRSTIVNRRFHRYKPPNRGPRTPLEVGCGR